MKEDEFGFMFFFCLFISYFFVAIENRGINIYIDTINMIVILILIITTSFYYGKKGEKK